MEKSKATIKKIDGQFCVFSQDGSRRFGCFATEEQAKKRLAQIEFFKNKGMNQINSPEEAVHNVGHAFKLGTIAGIPSALVRDGKHHFPILDESQANSAVKRVLACQQVPNWFSGELESLRSFICQTVAARYPNLYINTPIDIRSLSQVIAEEIQVNQIKNPNAKNKSKVPEITTPTLENTDSKNPDKTNNKPSAIKGQVEPGKESNKSLDPNAKVRNRGKVVFPAGSQKVKDNKDHFPINDETQARNALQRVNQFSSSPPWFTGSLQELVNSVVSAVRRAYPGIKIGKSANKPGKAFLIAATIYGDTEDKKTIAANLIEMLQSKKVHIDNAITLAERLMKKGLSGKEFQSLIGFLQEEILRDMMTSEMKASSRLKVLTQVLKNRRDGK